MVTQGFMPKLSSDKTIELFLIIHVHSFWALVGFSVFIGIEYCFLPVRNHWCRPSLIKISVLVPIIAPAFPAIHCPLPELDDGQYSVTGTALNATARVVCDHGFVPQTGSEIGSCLSNATWSFTSTTCGSGIDNVVFVLEHTMDVSVHRYLCVRAGVRAFVSECVRACVRACAWMCLSAGEFVGMCVHVHLRTHTCTFVHAHVRVWYPLLKSWQLYSFDMFTKFSYHITVLM